MKIKGLLIGAVTVFCAYSVQAQVAIGSDKNPDASAILDLRNPDNGISYKGLLFPRVAIADTTRFGLENDSRTEGMVVYNTENNNKNSGPGLYFWSGSSWIRMKGADDLSDWSTSGNTVGSVKILGTKDNFDMPFITNDVERMRLSADGKVGVGTSAPKSRFSVRGGALSQDDFADGDKLLLYGGSSKASKISINPGHDLGFYSGSLVQPDGVSPLNTDNGFYTWNVAKATNTWKEVMKLTNAGFLGIGTGNPLAKLHVAGVTTIEGQLILPNIPAAGSTDRLLTVDPSNTIRQCVTVAPEMSKFTSSIAAGSSSVFSASRTGTLRTISVVTANSCNESAIASFNFYPATGILTYVGGSAKGVEYTVNPVNKGKVALSANITPCSGGGGSQFNLSLECTNGNFTLTNNGTGNLVYSITSIDY